MSASFGLAQDSEVGRMEFRPHSREETKDLDTKPEKLRSQRKIAKKVKPHDTSGRTSNIRSDTRKRNAHSRDLIRDEALIRAFKAVGGQSALATLIGRSKQATWHWRRVPSNFVLKVEELTGISRHELRPDLYPKEERQATQSDDGDISNAA